MAELILGDDDCDGWVQEWSGLCGKVLNEVADALDEFIGNRLLEWRPERV